MFIENNCRKEGNKHTVNVFITDVSIIKMSYLCLRSESEDKLNVWSDGLINEMTWIHVCVYIYYFPLV